jgi:uncharacterized protein YdaU (DUF1376 family)
MRGGFLGVLSFYNIMAENKKSFVLYADLIKSLEHLTNEEKGILFNHLLEYVNDMKPVLTDRLILTAWKPIELQLKRDLIKFEEVKAKRSEAGKRSAELRALKNDETNTTNSTSVESVKQASTNSTDNVNVNVTDNVNDNVIKKKESLETRSLAFKETLRPFINKFGVDMVKNFYGYWSEPNQSKTKMLFEMQKTWDTSRRLETWSKREKDFTKKEDKPKNLGI